MTRSARRAKFRRSILGILVVHNAAAQNGLAIVLVAGRAARKLFWQLF